MHVSFLKLWNISKKSTNRASNELLHTDAILFTRRVMRARDTICIMAKRDLDARRSLIQFIKWTRGDFKQQGYSAGMLG